VSRRGIEKSEKKNAEAEGLSRAVEALKKGEVIVFPTETFYGLGADALNEAAVEQVFSLKGRDPRNPLPLIIAKPEMLDSVASEVPPLAGKLARRFWPGPLTLVLPARLGLPAPLLNSEGGVGVRVSSHPAARGLAEKLTHPITATSANPSGKEPARTIAEARAYFSGKVGFFLDGGRLEGKKGSTVVEVAGDKLRIIREGEIPSIELEKACLS